MAEDRLKLAALDADDLEVISAHLQDAVMRVGDMTWRPAERRFAAVLSRFDWVHAIDHARGPFRRRSSGLSIDRVAKAQLRGITPGEGAAVLSLLAVSFEPDASPGGDIVLRFSGGAAIRLTVECIEVRLGDLGAAWKTVRRPGHAEAER